MVREESARTSACWRALGDLTCGFAPQSGAMVKPRPHLGNYRASPRPDGSTGRAVTSIREMRHAAPARGKPRPGLRGHRVFRPRHPCEMGKVPQYGLNFKLFAATKRRRCPPRAKHDWHEETPQRRHGHLPHDGQAY